MQGDATFDVDQQQAGSIYNVGGDHITYADSDAAAWAAMQGSGTGVKLLVALGMLLCLAGLGVFFFTMFTHNPEPGSDNFADIPPGVPVAFGIFFAGIVLAAVGSMLASMRKKR